MNRIKEIGYFNKRIIREMIEDDDPDELLYAPIYVSLNSPDFEWAQEICIELSCHPSPRVIENALLGFAHLARRFGKLNEKRVRPIIEQALFNEYPTIQAGAECAVMDTQHYLKWTYRHELSGRLKWYPIYKILDSKIVRFIRQRIANFDFEKPEYLKE